MASKPRVLVVFGGDSPEHEISCVTAAGVASAIDPGRYDTCWVGIARGGAWVSVDEDTVRSYRIAPGLLPAVDPGLPSALLVRRPGGVEVAQLDGERLTGAVPVDIALILLHGPYGEDGTIQGLFEMHGLPYVGAGVFSSAACQDKIAMNLILAAAGLPVGPYIGISDADWRWDRQAVLAKAAALVYPLFVKPARGGSSIGISRVEAQADLAAAIETARRHDPNVIVEQGFTDMREVECGVLVDRREAAPAVSALGEIRVNKVDKFYDFEAKYLAEEQVDLVIPAPLEPDLAREAVRLAAAACQALGVEGLARVDTFVTAAGVYINEVNTMPGFTPRSLFPRVWAASGLAYTDLVTRLIEEALARPQGLR
ncbi:MAG: D-alanine--D-alanine ligase [Propionibacteriaceae bacterium]|jgi:D-alanine-D-alanine ligase|nr:D-alanine--D-alanine ligase [Propionibacteriaceae bacterium]